MTTSAGTEGRRRRLDAATRRRTIIEAAIAEFTAAGYEQTRVADIAARVGVTEPVVFQNFGTKAGLFAAVLDQVSAEVDRYLTFIGDRTHDVGELLSVLLTSELHERLHSPGGIGMLFADAAQSTEAAIREAGVRANERVSEAIAAMLRRGQGEGAIRADVEPRLLAWLVLSQVHARQYRAMQGGGTSPALEQAVMEGILAALRPPAQDTPNSR
jgi:AcrR family transcriptional regulator